MALDWSEAHVRYRTGDLARGREDDVPRSCSGCVGRYDTGVVARITFGRDFKTRRSRMFGTLWSGWAGCTRKVRTKSQTSHRAAVPMYLRKYRYLLDRSAVRTETPTIVPIRGRRHPLSQSADSHFSPETGPPFGNAGARELRFPSKAANVCFAPQQAPAGRPKATGTIPRAFPGPRSQ
jgi:hypothetical protein